MEDPEHIAMLVKYDQEFWYKSSSDYTRWAQQASAAEKVVIEHLR
jgi:hypothetical protein